ncbi:TRI10 protein, partial [Alcedo cyanopectus]|nr:TRI10 protein [Ceyx cyanopectus]
ITLDPCTAHPLLVLSGDGRSVRWAHGPGSPREDPRRFDSVLCVLGTPGFSSGRHCWVVDLAGGRHCAVGVSRESLPRKGPVPFRPSRGIWAVQRWDFQTRALTDPPTPLRLPGAPRKIRVGLDYEWGEVTFRDADSSRPIFAFPPQAFGGETLRP